MQLSGFRRKLCWKKKKPVVTEKLEWLIQPKSIWNAFNVCFALSNFQCWDQEFQFSTPMLLYKCEVSNCVFFGKKLYSICSYAEIWVWIWGENNFSNIFWNFRTIRILIDQLNNLVFLSCFPIKLWCFPFRIGWKNPTRSDEEVWLSGTC